MNDNEFNNSEKDNATQNQRFRIGDHVTIYPRGKKNTWYADYHHDGRHCRTSLKTSNRKIAEQRARELDVSLHGGQFKQATKPTAMVDAKELFIADLKALGRAHKTIVKYQREIENFIAFAKQSGVTTLQRISIPLFDRYRVHRNT